MVNRQTRSPGQLRRFDEVGRVSSDVPSWAVDSGQAFRALAEVAGGLGARLGKLADDATKREKFLEGFTETARSGAAYLRMEAAQTAGAERARPAAQAAIGGSAPLTYENHRATRKDRLTPRLEGKVQDAVFAVYGEGYRAVVYSGGQPDKGSGGARTGSVRHDHGKAGDIHVYGPDGSRVTGDGLAPLGQYWAARKYGGVGLEMRGGGIHLDDHETPPPGGGMHWNYAGQGGQYTPAQRAAMEAGLRGELPALKGLAAPATAAGAAPGGKAAAYMAHLTARGLSPVAAAGVVGHLQAESGLDPVGAVGDSGTAFGLAQWRGNRFDNLKRFAAARGTSWQDETTQLDFIVHELGTSETTAGRALADAGTVEDATKAFMHFERPRGYSRVAPEGGLGYEKRLANARALVGTSSPHSAAGARTGGASDANVASAAVMGPTLPDKPFALRRDGTIAGDAYDAGVMAAWSWRFESGLRTAMQAAFEAHQDDPAGLTDALMKVHDKWGSDPNLRDPEMREVFDRQFGERSEVHLRTARANAEVKLRNEVTATASEGIAAQRLDIERQAVALGANPDGDVLIRREVERAGRSIDAAMANGTITPAQATKAKADLALSAVRGRIFGTFEAIEAPADKEEFVTRLMEEWAGGKDPLLRTLDYPTVKAITDQLFSDARERSRRLSAEERIEAARLEGMIGDDVASLSSTGRGLDPLSSGLEPQRILDLLGEDRFERWRRDRDFAQRAFQAGAGMETETPEEIAERLSTLAPQPGQPGFDQAQRIHEAATKRASQLVKERTEDPALYVLRYYPGMMERWQAAQQDGDIRAFGHMMLAAQADLGVDEGDRRILSGTGRSALASRFLFQQEGGEGPALLMRAEKTRWGDLWPRVFGELASDLPGPVLIVGAMDFPGQERAAEQLAEGIAAGGDPTYRKLLPTTAINDARERVMDRIAPFVETLADLPGSEATSTAAVEAVNLLAMRYMASGDSAQRAADRAFEDVVGRKYVLQDGYRVPRTVDQERIAEGARLVMADFAEGEFAIDLPFSDLDDDGTRDAFVSVVLDGGRWRTSPLEDGLTLYAPDGAAVTIGDKPLSFSWSELSGYRRARAGEFMKFADPPTIYNMDYRSVLDRYLRGEMTAKEMRRFNPVPLEGGE